MTEIITLVDKDYKTTTIKYVVIVTRVYIFVTIHWTAHLEWEYINYSSNRLIF